MLLSASRPGEPVRSQAAGPAPRGQGGAPARARRGRATLPWRTRTAAMVSEAGDAARSLARPRLDSSSQLAEVAARTALATARPRGAIGPKCPSR
eukprot:scaffold284256_cov33-Tisochrysis_lutea.AAC.1